MKNEFGKFNLEAEETQVLSDKEIESIKMRADIRRRQQRFKTTILNLDVFTDEGSKEIYESEKQSLFRVANGEVNPEIIAMSRKSKEEIAHETEKFEREAVADKVFLPDKAAFCYAQIAELKELSGADFSVDLEQAKLLSLKSKKLSSNYLSDCVVDAIILGIETRAVQKLSVPAPEKMAVSAADNIELLRDYALVLSESERQGFIDALPESKRRKISAIMDNELSKLLKENNIETESLKSQAAVLKARVQEELQSILASPSEANTGIVKALSGALANLDSEDAKRILFELGKFSVRGEGAGKVSKDKEKQDLKISYAARILKTLADIDIAKGGNLAMKFLARKEVPPRYFQFFCKNLIESEYLTRKLEIYLKDEQNLPFLRKLIANYPNQFNTVLDTISKIEDYNPAEHEEEVFSAITDLDTLTPIIFDRYRKADVEGKKKLSRQIRELKPKFFRNTPIKGILNREDRSILAEMIFLAYRPDTSPGMSFEKVQALIKSLEDQTEDLEGYKFPEDGYDFSLETKQKIVLKEGESIDLRRLNSLKDLLLKSYPEDEKAVKSFSALLTRLAKAGTEFKTEETAVLLSIMSRDEFVADFTRRFERVGEENAYDFLNGIKEILGVYFKDNYDERLGNFLGANKTIEGHLMKILSNSGRVEVLKRKLGKALADKVDWKSLNKKERVVDLLTLFAGDKVLRPIREAVNKDLSKFTAEEGERVASSVKNLKAYISKNIGSFFAKASAGICTFEDIPLFQRNDHFHINIVENGEYVRANVQAYIVSIDGKKSLVLRGFNPNMNFVDKIDVGSFCEKVLEIARRFQKDNDLAGVYITEHLPVWHALSNREKVSSYLIKRYVKEKNRVHCSLQISSGQSVSSVYRV